MPFIFVSTLIRLNPNLRYIKAFGTDGECELIKAFKCAFPDAIHLHCTNHLHQNIKDKLNHLKIKSSVAKEFTFDIFGVQVGSHMQLGLIDMKNEVTFEAALNSLREKWNNLERSCIGDGDPQFHSWFIKYQAPVIKASVLPTIRAKAHIDVNIHFTTNASESINSLIKKEVDWKESKLPMLTKHLKAIGERQVAEYQKAVISRGEWKFTSAHHDLEISESTWFSMTLTQKEKHLMTALNTIPIVDLPVHIREVCVGLDEKSVLDIDAESISTSITSVAPDTLHSIWKKASELVTSQSIVTPTMDSRVRGIGNSYNTHLKTILYYMGHMVQPSGLGM